jgi:hypothetical protein
MESDMPRQQQAELIYNTTHTDFRGVWNGERYILTCRSGATSMVYLTEMTDTEIADRLPAALRRRNEIQ